MMSANDALVLIFSRNAFYKRLHYLVLAAFVLSLFVNAFLGLTLGYVLKNPRHPLYFATDDVGRLIPIVPLNTPNMKPDEVVSWTVDAVQAAYSYDYINFRQQLQDAQKYFTNYGWNNYLDALKLSNNLLALTERKQIVTAKVVAPPKLLAEGQLGGSYAWKFQIPVLIVYQEAPYDGSNESNNSWLITVVVKRQNILEGYKGLGIVQIISDLASSDVTSPAPTISNTSTTGDGN